MTYPLFEIKLLTALDHAQFEEAIWAFEIDGDISTLLLIDGEFKHEVRQFQKPYDNQQAEQISLMV